MMKNNIILRIGMTEYDFKQYEVAEIYGCSEYTFSRMLREELPKEFQSQMVDLLRKKRYGEDYDDSFIKKYKEQKRTESAWERNETKAERYANYINYYINKKGDSKKNDRILDEMQEKRLLERGFF